MWESLSFSSLEQSVLTLSSNTGAEDPFFSPTDLLGPDAVGVVIAYNIKYRSSGVGTWKVLGERKIPQGDKS